VLARYPPVSGISRLKSWLKKAEQMAQSLAIAAEQHKICHGGSATHWG